MQSASRAHAERMQSACIRARALERVQSACKQSACRQLCALAKPISRPVFLRMAFSIASLFLKRSVDSLVITTILWPSACSRRSTACGCTKRGLATRGGSRGGAHLAGGGTPSHGSSAPEGRHGGEAAAPRPPRAAVRRCRKRGLASHRQHRRHVREQVGPSVRIEATECRLGERVVKVESSDARRRRRREVRPHEERAANDAPAGRHLDAAQGGAHVALALAPQCGARSRLILAVAELYHVHRRLAAGAGFPSQSIRCGQPRVVGRMVVLLPMVPVLTVAANSVHAERLTGRADEGRERAREALEHAVCAVRRGARSFSSGRNDRTLDEIQLYIAIHYTTLQHPSGGATRPTIING